MKFARPECLQISGLISAPLLLSGALHATPAASAKGKALACSPHPNIIYIMSDDHTCQTISTYGGILAKVMPTPNIDRLAREGVRFENCYATNSISVPSRATILTGQYSQINGVYTLNDALDPKLPTLAKELQKAGYATAMIGKWHLTTEPQGFDYYTILPGQGRYFDPILIEKGSWGSDPYVTPKGTVHKGHSTDIITDLALDWLSKQQSPFMLMCHFKAPHAPWDCAPRFDTLFQNTVIPEPANLLDVYEGKVWQMAGIKNKLEDLNERQYKVSLPEGMTRDEKRHWAYQYYLKRYMRCIAGIDENVGRILDWLDKSGMTDHTVVVYTSDQGFFMGEHGMFDKRLMYDEAIRMPLLVRFGREVPPGSLNSDVVRNLDFAPTLLDMAGVMIPSYMQGRSFRANMAGHTPHDWKQYMYYRYWMNSDQNHHMPAHYGIRTKDHKLILFYGLSLGMTGSGEAQPNPGSEFYDLRKDPAEMVNRYDDPAYAKIIADLKQKLLSEKERYDDQDSKYPEMEPLLKQWW